MTIKQQGGIFGRNPTFNVLTAGTGSSIEGSGSNVSFKVDRTDASTDGALVLTAKSAVVNIDSDGADKDLTFSTAGGTERARFFGNQGGLWLRSGNLVVDSGYGIDFSATSGTGTSELFDDYEEGTWTPTVQGAGTAGTYTLSGTTAKYTKVGNQVTLWAQFGFSAASGGTNYIVIGGLPFTYAAGAGVFGALRADSFNFTTATPASLVVAATTGLSGTTLGILELSDNAGPVDAPISGVSTSTLIGFTITYQV